MRVETCSCVCRPMASRMRASTSAGPAVDEDDVVDAPVGRDRRQAALGDDEHERSVEARRVEDLAQRLRADEVERASTKMRSALGAFTSWAGSAGIWRTRWLSSSSEGRTGPPPCAELRIRSCAKRVILPAQADAT